MKLFYFGSVCSNEKFNETVAKSKVKPSASAQNFESALIKGFSANRDVELKVASAESIAMFPGGNRIYLKKRRDILNDRCTADIIPTLNLPFFKQTGHAHGATRLLKRWLKENEGESDKCVLVYGIYPAVVKKLQRVCHKQGCRICALITDVPSTMFTYTKSKNPLKKMFSGSYRQMAVKLQNKFDGYVYLTEAMKDEIAPGKPYIVVETIADRDIFNGVDVRAKADPPVLMYAGALYKKYGVDLIVDSFELLASDCELWLFGSGDYEDELAEKVKKNQNIKFFGRVSREEVLARELQATMLLNIRDGEDEYTKYSFPSKMIEYMLSGTPLVTTKLSGIPDEYYKYCYVVSERTPEKIAKQISGILSSEDIGQMGEQAKAFVIKEKNSEVQARRIVDFLCQQL